MTNDTRPLWIVCSDPAANDLIEQHLPTLRAMGPLPVFDGTAPPNYRGPVPVKKYHLNTAQTAFIATKLGTEQADRHTALMAEVFALYSTGKLKAVDSQTWDKLCAAVLREATPTV